MSGQPVSEAEYLRAVGSVVNLATVADALGSTALALIAGLEVKTAEAIYFTLDAMPAKKRMLNRIAEVTCDDTEKLVLKQLIEAIETANNQRIEVAHAHVRYGDNASLLKVSPRNQSGQHQRITKTYLAQLEFNARLALRTADGLVNALYSMRRQRGQTVPDFDALTRKTE